MQPRARRLVAGATIWLPIAGTALGQGSDSSRELPGLARADGVTAGISVAQFGAVPDDGNDDAPAIRRALDSLGTKGGSLVFPRGTYDIAGLIEPRPGLEYITLVGESGAILKKAPGFSSPNGQMLSFRGCRSVSVRNLVFVGATPSVKPGDRQSEGDHALAFLGCTDTRVIENTFRGIGAAALTIRSWMNRRPVPEAQDHCCSIVAFNTFDNIFNTSTSGGGTQSLVWIGNISRSVGGSHKFSTQIPPHQRFLVRDNIIQGASLGYVFQTASHALVAGNHIEDVRGWCIQFSTFNNPTGQPQWTRPAPWGHDRIEGNSCVRTDGIEISNRAAPNGAHYVAEDIRITGNALIESHPTSVPQILVKDGPFRGVTISANTFHGSPDSREFIVVQPWTDGANVDELISIRDNMADRGAKPFVIVREMQGHAPRRITGVSIRGNQPWYASADAFAAYVFPRNGADPKIDRFDFDGLASDGRLPPGRRARPAHFATWTSIRRRRRRALTQAAPVSGDQHRNRDGLYQNGADRRSGDAEPIEQGLHGHQQDDRGSQVRQEDEPRPFGRAQGGAEYDHHKHQEVCGGIPAHQPAKRCKIASKQKAEPELGYSRERQDDCSGRPASDPADPGDVSRQGGRSVTGEVLGGPHRRYVVQRQAQHVGQSEQCVGGTQGAHGSRAEQRAGDEEIEMGRGPLQQRRDAQPAREAPVPPEYGAELPGLPVDGSRQHTAGDSGDGERRRGDPKRIRGRHFQPERSRYQRRYLTGIADSVDQQSGRSSAAREEIAPQEVLGLVCRARRGHRCQQIADTPRRNCRSHGCRTCGHGKSRQQDEAPLLKEHGAEIVPGPGGILFRTDAHHRGTDQGVLQVGNEKHHHPGQGIGPESGDTDRTRNHHASQKIDRAHQRLVGDGHHARRHPVWDPARDPGAMAGG